MKPIKVSHSELGSITAESPNSISNRKKLLIKSLACLQLVCMTPDSEEDGHFQELLDIITNAAHTASNLYKDNENANPVEQF